MNESGENQKPHSKRKTVLNKEKKDLAETADQLRLNFKLYTTQSSG
jgi:hypothetical protein